MRTVEAGNITRAAVQLNLAQTALGLQIRQLEDSLGVKLLVRHSRGISPTDAGRLLYERAVAILQLIGETRRDVLALGGTSLEEITLGVTPSILRLIGPDLLVAARDGLPGIAIRLVEELSFILVDALMRGELDLALAYEATGRPGLELTALIEEDLLFITAPEAPFAPGPVRFSDTLTSDLALASDRDVVWRLVHETAARLSLPVNVAFRVQSIQAIKTLVTRGVATSIAPFGLVAEEVEQGLITAHAIERPLIRRTLFLARSTSGARFVHEAWLMGFLDDLVRHLQGKIGAHASLIGGGLGGAP